MTRDTVPFKNIDDKIFLFGDEIMMKKRPVMPENLDINVVKLIELCWDADPNKRPSIGIVAKEIEKLIETC